MDNLEVLRRSDVFHYLEESDLKEVEKMCTFELIEAGTILFKQDKELEKMYIVEEGLVGILIELAPTDRRQIQAVSNLECFGWEASIPPFHATCTAKALEQTRLLVFNGKTLRNLYYTDPRLCAAIAGGVAYVISQRLRASFSQLIGVTYQY
jgi:CRP-like cAMP-binding protein